MILTKISPKIIFDPQPATSLKANATPEKYDTKNHRKLMGQITTESRALERIESRLGRRDSSDILLGKTEFKTNHMHANGLVKVAEDLGQWFATGTTGPGTVTFRDKTYTAQ